MQYNKKYTQALLNYAPGNLSTTQAYANPEHRLQSLNEAIYHDNLT